jgi:hypothetical protein
MPKRSKLVYKRSKRSYLPNYLQILREAEKCLISNPDTKKKGTPPTEAIIINIALQYEKD